MFGTLYILVLLDLFTKLVFGWKLRVARWIVFTLIMGNMLYMAGQMIFMDRPADNVIRYWVLTFLFMSVCYLKVYLISLFTTAVVLKRKAAKKINQLLESFVGGGDVKEIEPSPEE